MGETWSKEVAAKDNSVADEVAALAQTKVTDLTQEELQKELATFSVENRRKLQAALIALDALDCQQLVDSGAGDLVFSQFSNTGHRKESMLLR